MLFGGGGEGGWDVSHTDLKELVAKFHLHSIRTLPQSTQWRIGLLEGGQKITNWLEAKKDSGELSRAEFSCCLGQV